jgi:hypothetical protein
MSLTSCLALLHDHADVRLACLGSRIVDGSLRPYLASTMMADPMKMKIPPTMTGSCNCP